MRDYGRVYTTIWADPAFRRMSEDGRVLLLYLQTCSHNTIAGVFRLPDGYACDDLQWPAERVVQAFHELLSNGFANRCETTKWVWVCKHMDENRPENPNQRKAAAKVALSTPEGCSWKPAFMRVCRELLGLEVPAAPDPSATVQKPLLNQEQEQEQEQQQEQQQQEQDKPAAAPDGAHGNQSINAQVWKVGRHLLKKQKNPGPLIASWIKAHGEERTLGAFRLAEGKPDDELVPYIVGCLRDKKPTRLRQVAPADEFTAELPDIKP